MKLALICSCIEPGRDGVGDYARELAVALVRQGHEVRMIGLAERFCAAPSQVAQESDGVSVLALKLPAHLPWIERLHRARTWLSIFQPDWVSLQFVIYGYARKGLPWRLSHRLGDLCDGWRVHLMMHETWIGFMPTSPFRHRAIGVLQRRIIVDLVRRLRPAVVHTSIPLYQLMLGRAGIGAKLLPIPSGIPLVPEARAEFAPVLASLDIRPENRASWLVLGIFGTLHPGHDYSVFLREQLAQAASGDRRLAVLTIGRTGAASAKILQEMQRVAAGRLMTHQFGEQSARTVSGFLQNLDYGVAASPSPFLGKSSAVAAMRLHSLEVLVPHRVLLPKFDQELGAQPDGNLLTRETKSFFAATIAGCLVDVLKISRKNSERN